MMEHSEYGIENDNMERLTHDGKFCDIVQCLYLVCPYPDRGCRWKQIYDKLREYEDTGMTPR